MLPETRAEVLRKIRADYRDFIDKQLRNLMREPRSDRGRAGQGRRDGDGPDRTAANLESAFTYREDLTMDHLVTPIVAVDAGPRPVALDHNRTHAPQFDVRVIKVTGHWLMLDKPTEFASIGGTNSYMHATVRQLDRIYDTLIDEVHRSLSSESHREIGEASPCSVLPQSLDELADAVTRALGEGLFVASRGAGPSCGDAALNTGWLIVDTRGTNRVLACDPATGIAEAEPDLSRRGVVLRGQ